jgi:hypothetical protein
MASESSYKAGVAALGCYLNLDMLERFEVSAAERRYRRTPIRNFRRLAGTPGPP